MVFHDQDGLSHPERRATFDTIPIRLPNGVFHPKLVVGLLATGEVRLLVSSANLTLSGWGRNREICTAIQLTDSAAARPLQLLLTWLCSHTDDRTTGRLRPLRDAVDALAQVPRTPDSPELIVTIPGETGTVMSRLATSTGTVTIASPYFHPRFAAWVQRELSGRSLRLLPALHEDGTIGITPADIRTLWSSDDVTFGHVQGAATDRFDHLKAISWAGHLLVGSHNATEAALGSEVIPTSPRNVEVSLLHRTSRMLPFSPVTHPPAGLQGVERLAPEDTRRLKTPILVDVLADWEHEVFLLRTSGSLSGASIALPGCRTSEDLRLDEQRIPFGENTERALLTQKWFLVTDDSNTVIARGLIREQGWRVWRRETMLTNLSGCLDAWLAGLTQLPAGKTRSLSEGSGDRDGEARTRSASIPLEGEDIFDNFFRLFRAVRALKAQLQEAEALTGEHRARMLGALIHSSPGSLRAAVELLEARHAQQSGWSVYLFTFLQEIEQVCVAVHARLPAADPLRDRGTTICLKRLKPMLAAQYACLDHARGLADSRQRRAIEFLLSELRGETS